MKKHISALSCAALCATILLSACSVGTTVAKVADVNGEPVYTREYRYFYVMYAMNMANQLGVEKDWEKEDFGGEKAGDFVKNQAYDEVIKLKVQAQKALESGIELSSELQSEIDQQRTSFVNSIGGTTAYQSFLKEYGFESAAIDSLIQWSVLSAKLNEKIFAEDQSIVDATDADVEKYFTDNFARVKHILIKSETDTMDESGGSVTLSKEEADAKALETANEALGKVASGGAFEDLVNEYNEDPGQDAGKGYVFTENEMDKAFEKAAFELSVGDYTTAPVKSAYGYHIIKRYPLSVSDEEFTSDKEGYKARYQSFLYANMLKQWVADAKIDKNEKQINSVKFKPQKPEPAQNTSENAGQPSDGEVPNTDE